MAKSEIGDDIVKLSSGTSGRILTATGWNFFAHFATQILRLAGNLVLTRLLAPDLFGVMAIVLSVQLLLANLSDFGLRPAVIRSTRGDDPAFLDTVWTLQLARGAVIWLVAALIASALHVAQLHGFIAADVAWGTPELPAALAVAALVAVIDGSQSTKFITAVRNFEFKKIVAIDLIAQVSGLSAMIGLAYAWHSIWSLITGGLISSTVAVVLGNYWLPGRSNRLAWESAALREVSRFGIWIMISSAASSAANQIDRLLFAGLMSAAMLGFYSIAVALATMVDTIGWRLLSNVFLPALSEAARRGESDFRAAVVKLRLPFDLYYLFASGALFASAPWLIGILYDQRYKEASEILTILSLGLIFSRYAVFNIIYMAIDQPQRHAAIMYAKLFSVVALILTLQNVFGPTGAFYAVALHGAGTLPLIVWFDRKSRLIDWRYELIVLTAWPLGYVVTLGFLRLIASILPLA